MKHRRYRKKNRAFKRKHPKNRNSTVSLFNIGPTLIPDEMFVKMRFNTAKNMLNSDGSFELRSFALNSTFQCDRAISSTQPMGRDEWQNFYNDYQVLGSKCEVEVAHGATQNRAVRVALTPVAGAGSITGIAQQLEAPYTKDVYMAQNNDSRKIVNYMSVKKLLGYHNEIYDVEGTQANFASDPSELALWEVSVANQPGDGITDIDYSITLTYYVRLFTRRILARS